MLEGGAMSKQDVEEKLHQLRTVYRAAIEQDKERLLQNFKETGKLQKKKRDLENKLWELKNQRHEIQQHLNVQREKYKKERQTALDELQILERTGLA